MKATKKKPASKLAKPKAGMRLSRGTVVGPGGRVGQFWTPPWLARGFVRWLGITPGMRVLDCGSGMGALSLAAAEAGGTVRAIEVDERLVERSSVMLGFAGVTLFQGDFLAAHDRRQTTIETGYASDIAISNPPWEKDYCERFFERMLEHAPRAAQILPTNALHGVQRASFYKYVTPTRMRFLPRRPSFDGSGSGKRDVMLLELTARASIRGPHDVDLVEIGIGE